MLSFIFMSGFDPSVSIIFSSFNCCGSSVKHLDLNVLPITYETLFYYANYNDML